MVYLIAGLILFLGAHSIRIFAERWRREKIAHIGPIKWKALLSLISILGFALLVVGYGQARLTPVELWQPPLWGRHLAILLTLLAFILLVSAYLPRNSIKAKMGHPMVLSVKVWALAHLLANGTLADLLLFGGFLLWAVLDFRASRKRDRAQALSREAGNLFATLLTVFIGTIAWAAFAIWGHAWLIGVSPLGM